LARRKAGLSWQQYFDHYENHHCHLGEKAMAGEAIRYIRHYLHAARPDAPAPAYDCVTEICFPDRASHDRFINRFRDRAFAKVLEDDEENFVDRSSIVRYLVESHASALDGAPSNAREATDLFRVFWAGRRKPELSLEAYIDYYETKHRHVGEEAMGGFAVSFTRHYLRAARSKDPAPVYDSITEACFPDRAAYDGYMARFAANRALQQRSAADVAAFIDLSSFAEYLVETRASVLGT
jgi:hypothetical protein